jgi:hypothetical protein
MPQQSVVGEIALRSGPGGLCGRKGHAGAVIGSVLTLVGEQRPSDAGVLVRQSDRCDVGMGARGKTPQPAMRRSRRMSLHLSQYRTCTEDEQRTQIPVTSFTDPQEARFASRGVLARHETQPGGQLAAVFESAYIADACHQRTGT